MSTPEVLFKNALNVYSHTLGGGVSVNGSYQLAPGQMNQYASCMPRSTPACDDQQYRIQAANIFRNGE